MSEAVLDSSALLAVILEEPGGESVRIHLPGALLSSVNLAEIVSRLGERGVSGEEARQTVSGLGVYVVPFDEDQAVITGELRGPTKPLGLSLGDRACLALAHVQETKVVTADSAWRHVSGFDIEFIRGGGQEGQT